MTMKVSDLMSPDVETIYEDETMDLANTILTLGRIRHLPVTTRDGKLIGLVTQRDLARGVAQLYKDHGAKADDLDMKVTEMMTGDIATITPDAPLLEAAETIWETKYGCLPVVTKEGELVGIVTEADFVRYTINSLR